jgi:HAD superfamily hydrolase (TIGR01509 family)
VSERRPQAIIFDLDGTLVDTVPARISAWRETLTEAGIQVADAHLEPMIGMDGRALATEVARATGRVLEEAEAEDIDRLAGERFDTHNHSPAPLPGARQALDRLDAAGVTWAIATSSRAEQVAASVASLGLAHPPRIVDGSRVVRAKPAPDLLLLAASELAVEPGRTWYVGDSTWDMRAAAAAGMRPIAVLAGAAVGEAALRHAGAASVLSTLADLRLPN